MDMIRIEKLNGFLTRAPSALYAADYKLYERDTQSGSMLWVPEPIHP